MTARSICVTLAFSVTAFTAADVAASRADAPPTAAPEIIGRVRAVRLPCAVVRDLVGPAVSAAMDVDAAFGTARAQVRDYALTSGHHDSANAAQTMAMQRLDQTVGQMARGVKTIRRALGDPRIAPQHDPDIQALRDALEKLYAAESAKLNTISGYVEGERMGQLRSDDEGSSHARSAAAWPAIGVPDPARLLDTPAPFATLRPKIVTGPERQNPLAIPSAQPWIILDEDAAGAPRADDPRVHLAQLQDAASRQIVIVATGCH